jgi:hypothetical protein
MKNHKIYIYLILIIGVLILIHFSGIKGHVGSKETSPAVPVAIFILIVAGVIFVISSVNKFMARTLRSFAQQHRYNFSYTDEIGLTEKCNSMLGMGSQLAKNIVSFKEDNESYFVFHRGATRGSYIVCLIEMESNLNCNISVLPLASYRRISVFSPSTKAPLPGIFKRLETMVLMKKGLKELKLNNPEFHNDFTLYTDNPSIASDLLTDKVIWHTLEHLRKLKTGPATWGLNKNVIGVCLRKWFPGPGSIPEIEDLINYSRELKNYLIKK